MVNRGLIVLPPKRFERPGDTKYDQIRHKPWFGSLDKRRDKIRFLTPALSELRLGMPQNLAAEKWGVDERELRDFEGFWDKRPKVCPNRRLYEAILDEAYNGYCNDLADRNIRYWIAIACLPYGIQPRPVIEQWEVDSTFYPSNYPIGYRYDNK